MKGLLHRLAAKANGTAPTVRSNARLPFASSRLVMADETADGSVAIERETSLRTVTARPNSSAQPTKPTADLESETTRTDALAPISVVPSLMLSRRLTDTPLLVPPSAATSDAAQATVTPQQTHSQAVGRLTTEPEQATFGPPFPERFVDPVKHRQEKRQAGMSQSISEQVQDATRQRIEITAPTVIEIEQRKDSSRQAAALRPPHQAPTVIEIEQKKDFMQPSAAATPRAEDSFTDTFDSPLAEPAAMLPSSHRQASAALAVASSQKPAPVIASVTQTGDDSTEVHIHIGRIEVTAVQEAPAPRATPRKKPAPMSLDTYLAARSKK